ncbi:MAG: DUF3810 domain-containing protein [Oscillospiraceae bacterium]|jgi:hypothetical protein|nr:DUF3810 domain-containing protein [Oscillospiraceae bacterium]
MFEKRKVRRHFLRGGIAIFAMAVLSAALFAAVSHSESFAIRVYTPFSRAVSGWIGAAFSFTPYSAAEILLLLLALAVLAYLVCAIVAAVRRQNGWSLLRWVFDLLLTAVAVIFVFLLLWGCNYATPKLETRMPYDTSPQPQEVLFETAAWHLGQVRLHSELAGGDRSAFADVAGRAAVAVKALTEARPDLMGGGVVSPPKRMIFADVLGYLGISGIYSPFTGECHVTPIGTAPFLPSTMCHEMAHRLGFAPEEDANMIAYLACAGSGDALVRYSGELLAFNYCYGALSDPELRAALWNGLPQAAKDDYAANAEAWRQYEGPLRDVAASVNDTYLKAMRQPEGVKSYGRVVDMLIALNLERNSDN